MRLGRERSGFQISSARLWSSWTIFEIELNIFSLQRFEEMIYRTKSRKLSVSERNYLFLHTNLTFQNYLISASTFHGTVCSFSLTPPSPLLPSFLLNPGALLRSPTRLFDLFVWKGRETAATQAKHKGVEFAFLSRRNVCFKETCRQKWSSCTRPFVSRPSVYSVLCFSTLRVSDSTCARHRLSALGVVVSSCSDSSCNRFVVFLLFIWSVLRVSTLRVLGTSLVDSSCARFLVSLFPPVSRYLARNVKVYPQSFPPYVKFF